MTEPVLSRTKVCPIASCPNTLPCETHPNRERWGRSRSGRREQKLSRFVIQRDLGICYLCGQGGANEADHVIELQDGGEDSVRNMRAVHHDCHRQKNG